MNKRWLLCLAACFLLLSACQQEADSPVCDDPAKAVSPVPPIESPLPSDPKHPEDSDELLEPPADAPASDPQTTKESVSGDGFLTEIENQVLNLINQERLSLGLVELEYDPMLQNAARIRSKELCQDETMQSQTLSHTRPDGSSWATVLTRDIPVKGLVEAGEILAREKTTDGGGNSQDPIPAKDWFLLWKASEPHYDTITWPEAEKIGVGIFFEIRDGEYYTNATVLFGRYAAPSESPPNNEYDKAEN